MERRNIRERLQRLYGHEKGNAAYEKLELLIQKWQEPVSISLAKDTHQNQETLFSERDAVLIAYGDHLLREGENPLSTLATWCRKHLKNALSTVHVLPFHPSTSYEGYAITDYRAVEPKMGRWEDLVRLKEDFNLMMDLVLNHCSSEHPWFKQFLADEEPGRRYFTTMDSPETPWLKGVFRARNLPLLHPFETKNGIKNVWTTYSPDLIDMNWREADVFLEFMEIIFDSIARGARIIRLDAFVYVWKKEGTSCIDQAENHDLVRLFQSVLGAINASAVTILPSITNVTQSDNYAYFGKGEEERQADLIYHLPLSALLLYSLYKEDATVIREWLERLPEAPPNRAYLNLTASHDGIGLTWLKDLISDKAIDELIEKAVKHGALLSSRKKTVDDEDKPWELNATYFSACSPEDDKNIDEHLARFLATQNVVLSLRGVPALYLPLFLTGRNDYKRAEEWQDNRAINRGRFNIDEWEEKAKDNSTIEAKVLKGLTNLLRVRTSTPAFHPEGKQEIMQTGQKEILAISRTPASSDDKKVLCLTNFSSQSQRINGEQLQKKCNHTKEVIDLVTGEKRTMTDEMTLAPYQVLWLQDNKTQ